MPDLKPPRHTSTLPLSEAREAGDIAIAWGVSPMMGWGGSVPICRWGLVLSLSEAREAGGIALAWGVSPMLVGWVIFALDQRGFDPAREAGGIALAWGVSPMIGVGGFMPSTYSKLIYHLIFSTKHREPLITPTFATSSTRRSQGLSKVKTAFSSRSAECPITSTS
jgi:hypothetical protein